MLAPQVTLIALEEVPVPVGVPGTLGTAVQLPAVPPQELTSLRMAPDITVVPPLSTVPLFDAMVLVIWPLPASHTVTASVNFTPAATGAAIPLFAMISTP